MRQDDSDYEKLLKEAREWDARDRARHKSFGMDDDGGVEPPPAAPRPAVPAVDPGKAVAAGAEPKREPPPEAEMARPAASIRIALGKVAKQAQAHPAASGAKPKGNWGWIWLLLILYFVFKLFTR